MIYFDHNATTPLNPLVLDAMLPFLKGSCANPSSIHAQGRFARKAIDIAREQVAALVHAHPTQVIFTSGGTEANNAAIKGALRGMGGSRVACSAIEHPSVKDVVCFFDGLVHCDTVSVDEMGLIDRSDVIRLNHEKSPLLFSLMLANNETGALQDIESLTKLARENGHYMHTDAVQAVGKVPVDFVSLGVHLMTVSSHKMYGPKGAGAIIYDKALDLEPLIHGGGQEKGLRAGTENVPAIVGFGKAAEIAKANLAINQQYLEKLQSYFESRLRQFSGAIIFSEKVSRLPNTVFFSVPGVDGETLLMQLDEYDIAVTSGSACSSQSELPSHVLMAMGVDEQIARGAIRVSFGLQNTQTEIDAFFGVFKTIMDYNQNSLTF